MIIAPFDLRIAKPLLLVTTPIGVAFGLYEGWRLAGGLVFLMAAMLAVIGVAMWSVVRTIRRELEQEATNSAAAQHRAGIDPVDEGFVDKHSGGKDRVG